MKDNQDHAAKEGNANKIDLTRKGMMTRKGDECFHPRHRITMYLWHIFRKLIHFSRLTLCLRAKLIKNFLVPHELIQRLDLFLIRDVFQLNYLVTPNSRPQDCDAVMVDYLVLS